MMVVFYYNWKGTDEELKKYEKEAKENWANVKGVKLLGIYTPLISWNRAMFFETDSIDAMLKHSSKKHASISNTDMIIYI
jgi:hypothetical protein